MGLGFSLQQTAANPLAIIMGNPSKGSQRLSLAGGINNVGTTVGPLLVSFAIFGSISAGSSAAANIDSVKTPYLILGAAFLIVALIFKFSSVPDKIKAPEVNLATLEVTNAKEKKNAFAYPQLVLGMIAIFIYVGVEVSTAGHLSIFMKQKLDLSIDKITPYTALFWASLMIGRWTASVHVFNMKAGATKVLNFLMPYIAFAFFLLILKISGREIAPFYVYGFVILALIIGELLSKGNPAKQLLIYSLFGIIALLIGILSSGMISVFAFISVGLFCSTLWPCIYTLAIAGLGKHTNEGSGFLIMMIMGGGLISLLQGWLADDSLLGIQWSYIVGVACFLYLAFYAWKVKAILTEQGIDLSKKEMTSH